MDLSQWEGVAVWARRAPDSQPLLRVLVGNRTPTTTRFHAANDLERTKARYCERVRSARACFRMPVYVVPTGSGLLQPTPGYYHGAGATLCQHGATNPRTSATRPGNDPYPAYAANPDEFYGKPCTAYTRNGT
jgi:hypothetical protein